MSDSKRLAPCESSSISTSGGIQLINPFHSFDLLLMIADFASLGDLFNFSRVSSEFNRKIGNERDPWERQFRNHFPHLYDRIVEKTFFRWDVRFKNAYKAEYKSHPVSVRKLFTAAKERNLEELKNTDLIDFENTDNNGISVWDWIRKKKGQFIFDHFYQQPIKKRYLVPVEKKIDTINPAIRDNNNKSILYWAIFTHQSMEEISLLLEHGCRPDEYCSNQLSPIHVSALVGNLDAVELLLQQPAVITNINAASQNYAGDQGHHFNGRTAMHWAAAKGHAHVVQALLRTRANTTLRTTTQGVQPFHLAAENGHLEIIRILTEHDPTLLTQTDSRGETPLIWAAADGHLAVVEFLLQQRTVIDHINAASQNYAGNQGYFNGRTALHWAAMKGHAHVVHVLLCARADITLRTTMQGDQPLHLAAKSGHLEVIRVLAKHDPTLLTQTTSHGETPLICAAAGGHLSVVEFLLQQRTVIDHINAASQNYAGDLDYLNGYTALHWAVAKGHAHVVRALVAAGANVTLRSAYWRRQPIHLVAAENGHLEIIRILAEHDPTLLTQTDSRGETPLIWAAAGGHLAVVEFLLQQRTVIDHINAASRNYADNQGHFNGRTALHWAAVNGHAHVVQALLRARANTTLRTAIQGDQPLHLAAKLGHLSVADVLTNYNLGLLSEKNDYNKTPLEVANSHNQSAMAQHLASRPAELPIHVAARQGNVHQLRVLLSEGANVTAQKREFKIQAIHLAAGNGHLEIIRILAEHDPTLLTQTDSRGETPLIWAAAGGHLAVVEFLLQQRTVIDHINAASRNYADNQGHFNGRTALHWAAVNGHAHVVQALLRARANTTLRTAIQGDQPLHLAAKLGHLSVADVLTNYNLGLLSEKNDYNKTPLEVANSHNQSAMAQHLASRPAELPIHVAARQGNVHQLRVLLSEGANVTAQKREFKIQAIHLAAENGHLEIIRVLAEHDHTLLTQTNSHGETPLMWATACGHLAVVEFLLQQCTVVEQINVASQNYAGNQDHFNGRTALHWAATNRHAQVVQALLRAGANVAFETTLGEQSIHLAAKNGCLESIKVFLKNNESLLNRRNSNGYTPLMYAAANGHIEVVRFLLSCRSISIDDCCQTNKLTALHLACAQGHNEIAKLLLRAGATVRTVPRKAHEPVTVKTIKPICTTRINQKTKALLEIAQYAANRPHEPTYKRSFLCFNFGYSSREKADAAIALRDFSFFYEKGEIINNKENKKLKRGLGRYESVLSNGELSNIRQRLGIKVRGG